MTVVLPLSLCLGGGEELDEYDGRACFEYEVHIRASEQKESRTHVTRLMRHVTRFLAFRGCFAQPRTHAERVFIRTMVQVTECRNRFKTGTAWAQ